MVPQVRALWAAAFLTNEKGPKELCTASSSPMGLRHRDLSRAARVGTPLLLSFSRCSPRCSEPISRIALLAGARGGYILAVTGSNGFHGNRRHGLIPMLAGLECDNGF